MSEIAIVGAGLSGSVIARQLAEHGSRVTVFESRRHVAGNCHTARDAETGVMVHTYGPHIFHTSNEAAWNYVQRFDTFMPFVNRVKAHARGQVYALPINLMTINQHFGKQFSPEEARNLLQALRDKNIQTPVSFEEQALCYVGRELYETFFKGYTKKQWGLDPLDLPASILKRLPVRFNYDDNYYESRFQGIPKHGYTQLVENMLDHPNITLMLGAKFSKHQAADFVHSFYSGALDAWFEHSEGELAYRTLDFEVERYEGDFQGNAVINYCDEDVPWTRIAEHKHFTPWEQHSKTIIYREKSRLRTLSDEAYYPIRLIGDKAVLRKYINLAQEERGVTFIGRLGTYRYLDMHVAVAEALETSRRFIACLDEQVEMPSFCFDVLS